MLSPPDGRWRYQAAGFTIESEIEFPQLPAESNVAASPDLADIRFQRGSLPEGAGLRYARRKFAFAAVDGGCVLVSASAEASPLAVGLTVLSGGLNAVAYHRGLLPLHASAVALGDACVAFCGDGGAGKSALAAVLAQSGFPLLSDDLVIIHRDAEGAPVAWPAITRPKLTRETIHMLGAQLTPLTPPNHWDFKSITSVGPAASYVPRRLAAMYLLAWGKPGLRRLSALEAASLMPQCLRTPRWLGDSGAAGSLRRHWIAVVAAVPVFVASRPKEAASFTRLPETLVRSWRATDPHPNHYSIWRAS